MQASIQTPTNKLSNSQKFYQQLGYTLISKEDHLYSDGKVRIEINPDRFARVGINFYQSDWSSFRKQLTTSAAVIEKPNAFILCDPNGVLIYLKEGTLPTSPSSTPSTLGVFGGISIETIDLNTTLAFWKRFGYEVTQGSIEKGWITMSNETGLDISLVQLGVCPHLFFNPGLNYFNGEKNLSIIQQIKEVGIPITEEITHFNKEGLVDNIIIRDPGGLGYFIFND